MKNALITTMLFMAATQGYADGSNNEVRASMSFDELEYQVDDEAVAWSSTFSVGNDTHQFNVVSEGAHTCDGLDGHELKAYYSKAVSPKVGINLGWRGDLKPDPSRDWMLLGVSWEAPYELETETSLFIGSSGRSALRLEVARVCVITPVLTLTPELKANFYSENDIQTGTGSGLSDLEIAVRLAYQASPKFSPYIGVAWGRPYGKTSDFARTEGEHGSNSQFLFGFSLEL